MCGLLHRLADGHLPVWLVMSRDIEDAQRLVALGWIEFGPPVAGPPGVPGSDPARPLLVRAITPAGQAALQLAESGLWDLRVGCDAVCVSCAQAHACSNASLPARTRPALGVNGPAPGAHALEETPDRPRLP